MGHNAWYPKSCVKGANICLQRSKYTKSHSHSFWPQCMIPQICVKGVDTCLQRSKYTESHSTEWVNKKYTLFKLPRTFYWSILVEIFSDILSGYTLLIFWYQSYGLMFYAWLHRIEWGTIGLVQTKNIEKSLKQYSNVSRNLILKWQELIKSYENWQKIWKQSKNNAKWHISNWQALVWGEGNVPSSPLPSGYTTDQG